MQCEWKLKSKRSKLARKFKGGVGKSADNRIRYLNLLLNDEKWTSNSPKIIDQNLKIYLEDAYRDLLKCDTRELYWKY